MTDWDARYAEPEFAYGTEPNAFLAVVAHHIPVGPVLCLAEGQGRNAVFLAELGHAVVAVDQSAVGLARGQSLAASRNVRITTIASDLADFAIEPESWNGIVSIFAHLVPDLRARVHRDAVKGLAPGGMFVLEAYAPRQIELDTGGPRDAERFVTLAALQPELRGLEWIVAREIEREVLEGTRHTGLGYVVQLLGRKP
jgi:SAM-dependent methyltransferase